MNIDSKNAFLSLVVCENCRTKQIFRKRDGFIIGKNSAWNSIKLKLLNKLLKLFEIAWAT